MLTGGSMTARTGSHAHWERRQMSASTSILVTVWDERQPTQVPIYPQFLGTAIAEYLQSHEGLIVRSVGLDDAEQGLSADILEHTRVLIWWGHARHLAISDAIGRLLVKRIKSGQLSLVALHSAHWSTPFLEAMQERTRMDANALAGTVEAEVSVQFCRPENRFSKPNVGDEVTPSITRRKFPDGRQHFQVQLPRCIFPTYRNEGLPSQIRVVNPGHPIARDLPSTFELPQTEMYCEPFHVPEPDELILEERWSGGEWFRSGAVWQLGLGKVFYFRPGHETYPIYKDPNVLRVLLNAVRYLAD